MKRLVLNQTIVVIYGDFGHLYPFATLTAQTDPEKQINALLEPLIDELSKQVNFGKRLKAKKQAILKKDSLPISKTQSIDLEARQHGYAAFANVF
jgi:Tfp pilus assembly protein PilN